MSVHIIAFIFGLQNLTEFLDLLLHLEQTRNLGDILLRLEGLYHIAGAVFIVAVELRAIMGDAAKLFHIVHCIVGRNAHDCAHLISLAFVGRRPALAAHTVRLFKDHIIIIALFLQVHSGRETGRAAANDCYAYILVHFLFSFPLDCKLLIFMWNKISGCAIL